MGQLINSAKVAEIIYNQIIDAEGRPAFDYNDYDANNSFGPLLGTYYNLAAGLGGAAERPLTQCITLEKKEFQKLFQETQKQLKHAAKSLSQDDFSHLLERNISAIQKNDLAEDFSPFLEELLINEEVGLSEEKRAELLQLLAA